MQEIVRVWLSHPVTIEMYEYLKDLRFQLSEKIVTGGTADPAAYARSVGQIDTLDRILHLQFVEQEEEESNVESESGQ